MGKEVVLHFLGDVSFNDAYVQLYKKGIKPFNEPAEILTKADYVVGNLESQVAGPTGENTLKNPRVKTERAALNYLLDLHLDMVSVANNHTYDGLRGGFIESCSFLDEHKIKYLGATIDKSKLYAPAIVEVEGVRFGFLNYVNSDTHPSMPTDADVYLNMYAADKIIQQIKELKPQVDFLILLLHWGGLTDYGFYPHHTQIADARSFIDAGADAIIGHHTHTFQAYEQYKGKNIFYSLGNFCFADIYSADRFNPVRKSGKQGAIVELKFNIDDHSVKHRLYPIVNNNLIIQSAPQLQAKYNWRNFKFFFVKHLPPCRWAYYFYRANIEPLQFYIEASEKNWFQRIKNLNLKKIVSFARFVLNMKKSDGF